jgi:uncharacterized membrane protein
MFINQRLRIASLILAIAGFVDACYLIWIKISQNRALCFINSGDCFSVNNSKYSEIFGIPVSLFGALAYLTIMLILLVESRNGFFTDNGSLLIFGLSLVGVLYSAYLTYIELAVLRTICPFCVLSAIIMLLIFLLSIVRLARSQAQ